MGLWKLLTRLFGSDSSGDSEGLPSIRETVPGSSSVVTAETVNSESASPSQKDAPERRQLSLPPRPIKLQPLRAAGKNLRYKPLPKESDELPYRFAQFSVEFDGYLDLSTDCNPQQLQDWGLPLLQTPQDIAEWLDLPLGQLAWLIHRFSPNSQPENERSSHYCYQWLKKRKGGWRLLEAPKKTLKLVQEQILAEILNNVPVHDCAHGFVVDRSILTNAEPHTGQRVLVKLDLENFYPNVRFARVVSIFRAIGFSREAGIWLARLTTSALPPNLLRPEGASYGWYDDPLRPYFGRHLPQGAPTSPAIANLSAYSLDVRLAGLAKTFDANYTRYADDLTFSGSKRLLKALAVFLPLVAQIVQAERFRLNRHKWKVIRNNQRQQVTGVVVNEKTNVSRKDFDLLKAILTNCIRHGAASQNHQQVENFQAHLRGRIAHVAFLNAARGSKLMKLFEQIDFS